LHEVGEHVTPYYNFERFHESLKRPQVVKPIERKLKPQITSDQDYRPGDLVVHDVFGEGIIIAISSNVLTITFKNQSYGQKMISKSFGGLHKKGG
jgi:hypothetical protein